MDVNEWSDLRMFDNHLIIEEEITFDEEDAETREDENQEENEENQKHQTDRSNVEKTEEDASQTAAPKVEINDWGDLVKLDDDFDNDWYAVQEKKLAEQYGGNFIKVKYASHGRVLYICELCVAECNAKKSLELHCSGMKHLKKKDLWEKEGKPPPQIGLKKSEVDNRKYEELRPPTPKRRRSPPRSRDVRKRLGRKSRSPGRSSARWPRSRSPGRSRNKNRNRSRDRSLGRSRDRDRGRRSYTPDRKRSDWDRGGGRGESRLEDPFPPSPFNAPWPNADHDRRGGPPPFADSFDLGGLPPPLRERLGGHAEFDNFNRGNAGPPPNPYVYKRPSHNDPPAAPPPPKFSVNMVPYNAEKKETPSNPASGLLMKLSECTIKSHDDADLALSVMAALSKSLKDYSHEKGEKKIAELLMDAELKFSSVKALKVGFKMFPNHSQNPNPPSRGMQPPFHGQAQNLAQSNFGSNFGNNSGSNFGNNSGSNFGNNSGGRPNRPDTSFRNKPLGYPARYSLPQPNSGPMSFHPPPQHY